MLESRRRGGHGRRGPARVTVTSGWALTVSVRGRREGAGWPAGPVANGLGPTRVRCQFFFVLFLFFSVLFTQFIILVLSIQMT